MAHLLAVYMVGLILRSIGIGLIAGICCWKIRNAAVRHAVWVGVLLAMLLLPVCDYLLPADWVPVRMQQITIVSVRSAELPLAYSQFPVSDGVSSIQARAVNWWNVAAALYVLAAAAMFVRLFMGYRKVRQLLRRSNVIESRVWDEVLAEQSLPLRTPKLMESEVVHVPMTVGFVRPAIILPADWNTWDDWKLRAVLLHEMAHVRRGDWGIAVLAAVSRCAFWLNPLSWFLERQLSKLAEQSSDDASLAGTQNATRYAEVLLEFAAAAQNGRRLMRGGVAMAQHRMKARIERVLGKPVSGTGIVKMTGWMLVLILAAPVIYSAAALQVAAKPSPEPTPPPQIVSEAAGPVVELEKLNQKLNQLSVQIENKQQRYAEAEPKLQALAEKMAALAGLAQEPASPLVRMPTLDFGLFQGYFARGQVEELQTALQQLNSTIPPSPSPALVDLSDKLLDLPDNKADLRAYLETLAQLRLNQASSSFSVSVTGVQGRSIFIKAVGRDYSLGCTNCSFFVGESAIGSAPPEPSVPGITVRLNPDGSELFINCHAASCSVADYEVLSDGTQEFSNPPQKLESGATVPFRTAKPLRVIVSKN